MARKSCLSALGIAQRLKQFLARLQPELRCAPSALLLGADMRAAILCGADSRVVELVGGDVEAAILCGTDSRAVELIGSDDRIGRTRVSS